MSRNHHSARWATIAAFALSLAACVDAARTPSPPAGNAAITGRIAARDGMTILVVAPSPPPSGYDQASVRVHDDTLVLRASGGAASAADLRVGQGVRVWFDGPVMESYPVQSSAGTIVIVTEAP
jgi:hypothetical protein